MNQTVDEYEQKEYLKSLTEMKDYEFYDQEYFCIEQIWATRK